MPVTWKVDDALGYDLSVSNHDHQVRLESAKLLEAVRTANPLRLKDAGARGAVPIALRAIQRVADRAPWADRAA